MTSAIVPKPGCPIPLIPSVRTRRPAMKRDARRRIWAIVVASVNSSPKKSVMSSSAMSSRAPTTNADNDEPEEEEPPHGAACRGAIALGGDLRIRNRADARGNDPRQVGERLGDDVEAEGHRGQEEADDSLVEADHIDRRQASQEGLEPEPQHLPPRRRRVLLRVLGEPTDRKSESEEAPDEVDGRPQGHEEDKVRPVQHVEDDHAHDVGHARGDAEEVVCGEPALALEDREAEAQREDPGRQEKRDRGRHLDALRIGMHERGKRRGLNDEDCSHLERPDPGE